MRINGTNSFNIFTTNQNTVQSNAGKTNSVSTDIWELHNKKYRTAAETETYHEARKNNPELDRQLYEYDVAKYYEDLAKAEDISIKLANNEPITKEEEEFINEFDATGLMRQKVADGTYPSQGFGGFYKLQISSFEKFAEMQENYKKYLSQSNELMKKLSKSSLFI